MNRPFPRLEVLGLTAALAFVGACTPNNSVKPGAPVLTEMTLSSRTAAPSPRSPTSHGRHAPLPGGTGDQDAWIRRLCDRDLPAGSPRNILCRCIANPPPAAADGRPATQARRRQR